MHTLERPYEQLEALLAPQGIKTVTTGSDEIGAFLTRRWGTDDPEAQRARWAETLRQIEGARVVLLGVPMDCGAGFERGSFKGPLGVRARLLDTPGAWPLLEGLGVVDIGDVRVNAHMIDDSLHTPEHLQQVRRARGWDTPTLRELDLPVAPHSALARALELIRTLNPEARVLVLGGDHSISRVPVEALTRTARNPRKTLGILHFDAHTDLLSQRDGTPYTFATWAWHANEAIGRGGRLQQLGIRTSGKTAAQWRADLDVVQRWTDTILADEDAAITQTLDGLERAGVRRLYISNDIDATDPRWAAATGTMEPNGLPPSFITRAITAAAARFPIVGADLVEVAPPLKWHVPGEPARTLATAAHYAVHMILAMLDKLGDVDVESPCGVPAPAGLTPSPSPQDAERGDSPL